MAFVATPLVIKVEMTKENYKKLIEEAKMLFTDEYLEKYLFDGKFFTLFSDELDDFSLYDEARMICKYSEPTDNQVGLIFPYDGSWSYAIGDLFFANGTIEIYNSSDVENADMNYKHFKARKEKFLISKAITHYPDGTPFVNANWNIHNVDRKAGK